MRNDKDFDNHILPDFLEFAVPIQILKIQSGEVPLVTNRPDINKIIGQHGDDLLYGGKHCAEAAAAVIEAVALCAFAPGGITIFGRHFEATIPHERINA